MDFCKRCIGEFDRRDWRRGEEYFRRGAVHISCYYATGLDAKVQGSAASPYDVRLDWSDTGGGSDVLVVHCSCPRFDDMGLCKHVAAAIHAVDAAGIGEAVPGKRPLKLEPEEDVSGGLLGQNAVDDEWDEMSSPLALQRAGLSLIDLNRRRNAVLRPKANHWKKQLASLSQFIPEQGASDELPQPWSKPRQIWYVLDIERTLHRGWPCVSLRQRPIKKNGTPGKLKGVKLSREEVQNLQSDEDRMLIGLLAGNDRVEDYGYGYGYSNYGYSSYYKLSDFAVAPAMFDVVLPRLCASGRFGWLQDDELQRNDQIHPLTWDDGPVWNLYLSVSESPDRKHWQLEGNLQREGATVDLASPVALLALGLVIFRDRIARFEAGGAFAWVAMLRQSGTLLVPKKQEQELIAQVAQMSVVPPVEWPVELQWKEEHPTPLPQLTISKSNRSWEKDLECRLTFKYGEYSASFGNGPGAWFDQRPRRAVRRDLAAERAARDQLLAAGARRDRYYGQGTPELFSLTPAKMSALVLQLTAAGWRVEAEGQLIRGAGKVSCSVTSGVDWFDLEGACDYGGIQASLPQLLAALRKGQQFVQLDDGSQGMLPQQWLARYASLAELGQTKKNRLRFVLTQAALLDALLAAQDAECVTVDTEFARLREKLQCFEGIRPGKEPSSFAGELRPYQREGLGWLQFLDEFGFGGCLADDMGLGKTVQVLALVDQRRRKTTDDDSRQQRPAFGANSGPSLVVVPRSLVFNWIEEARRFTPQLRVLNYTGADRHAADGQLDDHDLVVTTYGTLRRDIEQLRHHTFDYAILDEAQAIKNASSQAAKACRLLRAGRRLAMTGTPVENHLGELWSLFEFLNPGMFGRNPKLHELFSVKRSGSVCSLNGSSENGAPDAGPHRAEGLTILSRALRPFMLRRTKQQVLTELPPKTQQTLYCELDGAERKLYNELRAHYRGNLLDRVRKVGMNKAKIHVLEALLRLRQAACHPGLLDKEKIDAGSSKLDTLLEQLAEILDEGHKALVFSQFTSLLAIVRRRLDRRKIVYEYLDGKTTKRQAKVERFQNDPGCPLFLISLKAGGQGLNLTAADYVFILDPWWNPAVESQAIDRAHRIGQDRHVFAYRLIARDTVEEKILKLQQSKRDLAEAIVSADKSPLRNLTAEDLQMLLG